MYSHISFRAEPNRKEEYRCITPYQREVLNSNIITKFDKFHFANREYKFTQRSDFITSLRKGIDIRGSAPAEGGDKGYKREIEGLLELRRFRIDNVDRVERFIDPDRVQACTTRR